MKLPLAISKLEDVDEALRKYYVEKDGQYVLDTDETETQRKLQEFRNNNIELKKEKDRLLGELDKFKDIDPKKYSEAQQALQKLQEIEEQNLISEGKLEEVVNQRTERMRADFTAKNEALMNKNAELEQSVTTYKGKLQETLVNSSIQQAITEIAVPKKGAMVDLLSRANSVWKIDENGALTPMNGDKPIYGKDGDKLMTPQEWAESQVREAPFLFESNAGGGAGGNDDKGGAGGNVISSDDKTAVNSNIENIASGKVVVDINQ